MIPYLNFIQDFQNRSIKLFVEESGLLSIFAESYRCKIRFHSSYISYHIGNGEFSPSNIGIGLKNLTSVSSKDKTERSLSQCH